MAYDCTLIECYPGFGPTLVTDGKMEVAPTTNWTAGGGAAIAANAVTVRNGCQSLRVTDGGAGGGYAYQDITVEAGHKYKIETWGYSAAAGDTWRVRIYVGGAVVWTGATHDVTAPVDWEHDLKFYRVPDGVTTIQIRLEVVGAAKVVYFDDVTVEREYPVPMNTIDLLFRATDDWSLWDQGLKINDPKVKEIWGGELEDQLVRREEGTRVLPLELNLVASGADALIDDVNELEEMLRHAAAFRMEGKRSGYGEVFLQFKTDNATHYVWYPAICGEIDKKNLMKKCCSDAVIDKVPVKIICEAYWESEFSYDLSNLLNNPGFEEWNGGICDSEPDCWTDYSTAGAAGRNDQETDIVEEGCEALRITMGTGVGAGAYQGVTQDITARLRADTEYTLLAWVQNTDAFVNCVAQVYAQGQNSGITYALNSGAANADYTIYDCQFTPNATDIANWVEIRLRILTTDINATGIIHIDKVLVMEASNVPTGWKGTDYLENHYDRDANEVNFFPVCDIPGEIPAESRFHFYSSSNCSNIRVARKTKNNPCSFIWQLIPCEGYTTTEAAGGCTPGLTDAICIDTDKVADATSPSGSAIRVTFVNLNMVLRAYWDITTDLPSYYGRYLFIVLANKSGVTDTMKMRMKAQAPTLYWEQDGIEEIAVGISGVAGDWTIHEGWNIFTFPVGSDRREFFDTGNRWRIMLYADSTGSTDTLDIAGVYIVPVEQRALAGHSTLMTMQSGFDGWISNIDGERGFFPHSSATNRYYSNTGYVGDLPTIIPEIENYFYFIFDYATTVDIDEGLICDLTYRPRGIFLRGSNP